MFSDSSENLVPATTPACYRKLTARIARLESIQDFYETQWQELNALLQIVGFEAGIASLKQGVHEMLACSLEEDD